MDDDLLTLPPQGSAPPVYRWATVTQAAPTRLRFDGDDTALDSGVWDMHGPRYAGERVYCQINNRRVVILGPNSKPEYVDLSTYISPGWEAYSETAPALTGIRHGPWVMLRGRVKPKSGNNLLGTPGAGASEMLTEVLPARFHLGPSSTEASYGYGRQQMSLNASWHVLALGGTQLRAERVDLAGLSEVTTGTWFPFGVVGMALDAF